MQLLKAITLVATFGTASAKLFFQKNNAQLDINQKVYIENAPVLGDGVGEDLLGKCTNFAKAHVDNAEAPKVKVCGTGIKATIYLRGDPPAHHEGSGCREYSKYQWTVGKCDKFMASDTCDEISPAMDANIGAAQSYIIEQC
eukprot:TRINITY_DN3511_c0_g1_i2.p2 TRINITY_DN3511_c0_g1~~TRINITY_DN3511_c0_g1_i2.p2  ORF type:complete len:142 (-),score=39.50 TRINITY_DN3511_c0_g1_i2:56-481(-)